MTLIARTQLYIQRNVRQSGRNDGFVPFRYEGQHRTMYRGRVGIDEQDQVGDTVLVEIVHHGLRYPSSHGKVQVLIGGTFKTDGTDRQLILGDLFVAAIEPETRLAYFHRGIDLFKSDLGIGSAQADQTREQKNDLLVHGIKIQGFAIHDANGLSMEGLGSENHLGPSSVI